jgi:TolB-like protein
VRESRLVRPLPAFLPRLLCLLLGLAALPCLAEGKPTVAVLYFGYTGDTAELRVLKKGLAQMLISDLSASGTVQLVERDRLQEVLHELTLGQSEKFDQDTVARLGSLTGAQYLVMGSYFDLMNTLVVDAKVVEVSTGNILRSHGARGGTEDFLGLEQKLATELNQGFEKMGVPRPPPPPTRLARRLTTQTALRYSRALDAKDRKDVETAKKELTLVLKEQPDFVLASTDLARLMK